MIEPAAIALATAMAMGLVELAMELGMKGISKGLNKAGTALKKGSTSTAKKGVKAAAGAGTKGIKGLLKSGANLVSKTGSMIIRNGKIVIKSLQKGLMRGAKKLKGLIDRILQKFKFKRFKLERKGKHIRLYGEVNPWVLLADGTIEEVDSLDGRKAGISTQAELDKIKSLKRSERKEVYKKAVAKEDGKIDFDSIKEPTTGNKSRNKPKERLPRTDGKWEGEPGNGKWYSDHPEAKEIIGDEPIIFKDGKPDFSRWSHYELEFELGQLNGTKADFDLVYKKLVKMGLAKNKTQAKDLLKSQGLTPHHFSNTEIQMIPSKLHGNIPHKGSASEMRNSNN
jgi:hypothetical protein